MNETSSPASQINTNPLVVTVQAPMEPTDTANETQPDNTIPMAAALPVDVDADVSTPAPVPLDPETPVSCTASSSHMQQRSLELINAARAEARMCGNESFAATTPLVWSLTLAQAATTQSDDMAEHNFFSHTGSDGSSIGDRVINTGYRWSTVGENIAAGQGTAGSAIQGWIDSPGHCRNLMNPNFTEVAVSCTEDSGADFTRYWTNVLAAPR